MKIKYEFVNEKGKETVEIEVEEKWGSILLELDRQEFNNNRTETRRRHFYEDERLLRVPDSNNTPEEEIELIEDKFLHDIEIKKLYNAIEKLRPRQKYLITEIYLKGRKSKEIAEEEGVTKSAVSIALSGALKKLKKFLTENP